MNIAASSQTDYDQAKEMSILQDRDTQGTVRRGATASKELRQLRGIEAILRAESAASVFLKKFCALKP